MKTKEISILKYLYIEPVSKEKLSILLGKINIKTVENTIKDYKLKDTVIYDTNLKKYRFNTLLPQYIPSSILLEYTNETISNHLMADVQSYLITELKKNSEKEILINTTELSPLLQNIIKLKLALVINASLKIVYTGNKQSEEEKHIKPHTIIYPNGFTYYLYGTYSDKNDKNHGEFRTFALMGIKNIEIDEIINPDIEQLNRNLLGNAYGEFKKEILLVFRNSAAGFYRRENILNNGTFKMISSNDRDNSILITMRYNNDNEVTQLLQRWMPHIQPYDVLQKEYFFEKIRENYDELVKGDTR